MPDFPNVNSPTSTNSPASSPSPIDVNSWRHALVPWKEGGREYTYLVPPGIECEAGYWVMIEKPNGTPSVFQVKEILPHEPTTFKCKPICQSYPDEQWQEMVQASHPERPALSMHPDYPQWVVEAADMFVEGR